MARRADRMGRVAAITAVAFGTTLVSVQGAAGAPPSRRIVDRAAGISFYLPATWRKAVVSTNRGSTTLKLTVTEPARGSSDIVLIFELPGRQVSAAELARGITSFVGSSVLSSSVVKLPIGRVERSTFAIRSSSSAAVVYGTGFNFYRDRHTYVVFFESLSRAVNNVAARTIMRSWGA